MSEETGNSEANSQEGTGQTGTQPANTDPKNDQKNASGQTSTQPKEGEGGKVAGGEVDYKKFYEDRQAELSQQNAEKLAKGVDEGTTKPEEYKLKWADKSKYSEGQKNYLNEWGREHKLSDEAAQGVADYGEKLLSIKDQDNAQLLQSQSAQWENELKEHPTLGGQNYENTIKNVGVFLSKFTSDNGAAVMKLLDMSYMGNNPDVLIPMSLAGAALADTGTHGQASNNANVDPSKMTQKQVSHTIYKGMN